MPGRSDQSGSRESEWEDGDPDAPQERDLADEDAEETATVPCPHCRREIPDFADRCPYCGEWVVQSSGTPRRRSFWFLLLIVLAILLILVCWVR